ncbi:MAG TPA: hypothetical protein VMP08_07440 [Anaerolineae bacterium]|nr:hypothetical protein [Anaerolineae bacterium]
MTPPDWGLIIGAVFTFLVLTYLIGDNVLFRLAVYILIGAGAAYAAVVVIIDVLWPGIQEALARAAARDFSLLIIEAIALLLGVMVWFKASPRLAWVGNIPMGYLIGVGAATVLGGAIIGTLGPQIVAAGAPVTSPSGGQPNAILTIIAAVGTIVTLLSFGYYRVGRNSPFQLVNITGRRFFLMIGLGAIFALVFMASVTLLYDRGATIVAAGREIQRLLPK